MSGSIENTGMEKQRDTEREGGSQACNEQFDRRVTCQSFSRSKVVADKHLFNKVMKYALLSLDIRDVQLMV